MNSLYWILFLSLLFWGFYQKWDEKRMEYTEHPARTFLYFIFASASIVLFYPSLIKVFEPSLMSVLFFVSVVWLTSFLYRILKKLFRGPKTDIGTDHAYWKLLNKKYIPAKLAEIIFQQTFFASVFLITIDNYGLNSKTLSVILLSFVLAHIPLFFLQGVKVGRTYLIWSIIGSPVFTFILLATESLWYTISIHMFFYTTLSMFSWLFTGTRYDD